MKAEMNKKLIKILFLTDVSGLGGQERVLAGFAKYLNNNKFKSYFCTLSGPGWLTEEVEALGIKCYSLGITNGINYPAGFMRLMKVIKEIQPDIIHSQLRFASFFGSLAGKIKRKPIVLSTRTYTSYFGKYEFLDPWAARFSDFMTAVSNSAKEILVRKERMPANKIRVLYNGIELKKFQAPSDEKIKECRNRFDLDNCIVIGIVANLHQIKGHRYLLEAAEILTKKFTNLRFLIVGDGILRKELEDFVSRAKLKKIVKFTGLQQGQDLVNILSIMDIFVHPSLNEGVSISIMEAMSMGKPVVATNVGGTPELVIDKKTGLLVKPKDSKALAEALAKLIKEPQLISEMGKNAQERIKNNFTIEKTVRNYENLYEELISLK